MQHDKDKTAVAEKSAECNSDDAEIVKMGASLAVFLKFGQLNLFKVYLSVFLITSCDNDKAAIAEMNRPGIPAPYLFLLGIHYWKTN